MKQMNSTSLSCLNLALTDKFQNTHVLCLDIFNRNDVCSNQTTISTMATGIKTQTNPLN